MTYYIEHFAENFYRYGEACVAKGFNKIDYTVWRDINACLKQENITIYLRHSSIFNDLKLKIVKEHSEIIADYTFSKAPYSFGDYLSGIYPEQWTSFHSRKDFTETNTNNLRADNSDTWTMTINNDKENKEMNTNKMFGNFDFGPVKENIKLSMYGMAVVGQDGRYIAYDAATDSMVDVEAFNFAAKSILYKMPVATKDVKVGDTVVHLRKPMYVKEVVDTNSLIVVDYVTSEEKIIKPVKNMFGFNFYTKVVNFLENAMPNTATANADNPFGNMWMFALMGEENADSALPIAMMLANQNGTAATANPFMLAMLMGDNKFEGNNLLPMLMMSQMMTPKAE